MGAAVVEGDESKTEETASSVVTSPPAAPVPPPFRIDGLLLLDPAGNDPVGIDAIVVGDDGIGVIRSPGDPPRVMPWSSVASHVVERWSGGVVPEWWVDPELNRPPAHGHDDSEPSVTDPRADRRPLPHVEPGVVIAFQTSFGTYRFLLRGGDPRDLSNRITDFAVRHRGLSGVPSVTTVAGTPVAGDRRIGSRAVERPSGWSRVQPYLVVALVVLIGVAVTVILLQSAGTIHLPYIGGSNPGATVPFRIR